ncbi:class I SAM-dependent methyltransferase [Taibaiella soli]|uniref:class I SAM-dependent methyltransferase n=1 Tax=Taibaiella soli TaxID=1649169 RepID=UPI001A9E69FA|nr:class I SAM-dependent methyltransferase [Taibaiella soli]
MKEIMDNFSNVADTYARYRPLSPLSLFQFLYEHVSRFENAWDVGTGNGQVATVLAEKFTKVYASDISQEQLNKARHKDNIEYIKARAEDAPKIPDNSIDLITVAQAIHWFDFDPFYAEVRRVARDGALFAAWTYNVVTIDPPTDKIIQHFYTDTVGPYWDKERRYIDEAYTTIPFPFQEIPSPIFDLTDEWTLDQLLGYLGTWSSVHHYREQKKEDPIDIIRPQLAAVWDKTEVKKMIWPVYLRLGKVNR